MLSFIVPAHNEEAWLGRCLSAIQTAAVETGEQHEVIVVDDASTDATSGIAREHGAQVIQVAHRQIAATRNSGAQQARGEILFFVDADTLVNARLIQAALRRVRAGAVGGGCVPRFEGWLPLWWRLFYPFAVAIVRLRRLPGGACLFCTRHAFAVAGGFSEQHYAAEEAPFIAALKRQGRFVVLAEPVITSGRSLRSTPWRTVARIFVRLALRGPDAFKSREGLDLWYRPQREKIQ